MNIAEELKRYLPSMLHEIAEINALTEVEGRRFDAMEQCLDNILDEYFIDDASSYGLSRLEKLFGIETDVRKPLDHRRSMLKAKRRGIGKVDAELLKDVANAYTSGNVDIEFDGVIKLILDQIPSSYPELELAIEQIKPAHLRTLFELIIAKTIIGISEDYNRWLYPFNDFTGWTLVSGETYENKTVSSHSLLSIINHFSKSKRNYELTGEELAGLKPIPSPYTSSHLEVTDNFSSGIWDYEVTKLAPIPTPSYEAELTIEQSFFQKANLFNICGDTFAGLEVYI